ncbi:MAG TPA: tetratricopeptide repeat protein [Armatimonadota bacterium]|jgi:hypothetical protein
MQAAILLARRLLPWFALLAGIAPTLAAPAPQQGRAIVVAAPTADRAGTAAFTDALLDVLAAQEAAPVLLVSAESALCRGAGLSGEKLTALQSEPAEPAAQDLLEWSRRLYVADFARLTVTPAANSAQVQILWARALVGQVRQATVSFSQALTAKTAPLLASQVARTLLEGWDQANTVAASGQTPGAGATPQPPIKPAPEAPPVAPTPVPSPPPATPPPATVPPATTTPVDTTPAPSLLDAARAAFAEGKTQRALDLIDRALHTPDEDHVAALLLQAQIFGLTQQSDQQHESLAAAVALDKTLYEPRLELAALERSRGLWQDAISMYEQAVAIQPQTPAAYVQLANLLDDRRQPERALKTLQTGVKAAPESVPLLLALAQAYRQRGLLAPAEDTFTRVAALATGARRLQALRELGHMYLQAGQYAAAFDSLRQAADLAPGDQGKSYQELFVACDQTVGQSLEAVFASLEALEAGDPALSREAAYQRMSTQVQQIKRIKDFAEPLELPAAEQLVQAQRVLYYSLALEAATDALTYVDTGDATLKTSAQQRREEAQALPAQWAPPPA